MHFNTKYINSGDSEKEIKDKINYNFNQILSFAIGNEGLQGPKGSTGIPGPSGKIGATGSTGERASEWYRGITFPTEGNPQDFDLWIDNSSPLGDIYERDSSSWSYTGLSLFNSNYFDVYSGIVGPLGITDKFAIGLDSSNIPDQTSLVISDYIFSSSDVNPNNSKLLISTLDQTESPIFSFVKSNGSSNGSPSFYWKNTGLFSDLIFKSSGKFSISSLLDLEISSYETSAGGYVNFYGESFQATTSGDINLLSQLCIKYSSGSSFILSSLNIGIDPLKLSTKVLTEIKYSTPGPGTNYILFSQPISGNTFNYFGGISINSNSSSRVFDFTGMDGHSVLYGLPRGLASTGNHKQVIFGSTGGATAGSTGAPYSYHVKRLNNVSVTSFGSSCIPYGGRNKNIIVQFGTNTDYTVLSSLDISDVSLWNSNMIVVTSSVSSDQYILIPGGFTSTLEPLYYEGEGNEYRVYLNDTSGSINKIKGIVYPYYFKGTIGVSIRYCYIDFPSPCSYVDLFWAYQGSSTNPNGRIFWKTCSGSSGILEMTNQYQIGANSAPFF